jgi:hypothetical protein
MKAEAAILRPVVNSDQNKPAINFKTCETLTLRVCVRQAVALADSSLKQRLCLLLADSVAKLPRGRAADFPRKDETSDNRRSMQPQTRYRNRL